MKLAQKVIGWYDFHGCVDITDPCYDRNTWCRMDNVEIADGEYMCITWIYRKRGKHPDRRIAIIGIYLDGCIPEQKDMEIIGQIGVDAGLAGFFHNKLDYDDTQWSDFCDMLRDGDEWITQEGFCSSSGFGDGYYSVYASKDKNEVINALEIRFI